MLRTADDSAELIELQSGDEPYPLYGEISLVPPAPLEVVLAEKDGARGGDRRICGAGGQRTGHRPAAMAPGPGPRRLALERGPDSGGREYRQSGLGRALPAQADAIQSGAAPAKRRLNDRTGELVR